MKEENVQEQPLQIGEMVDVPAITPGAQQNVAEEQIVFPQQNVAEEQIVFPQQNVAEEKVSLPES